MKSDVDVQAKREFIFACKDIRGGIDDRLQVHQTILLAGAALFDASAEVNREEWRIFTQRLNVESNFPGIQGVGFALRIPPDRLAQHVEQIRREGFPDYNVWPEGDRDAYSAIIYLEPFLGRNLRAFGYDMLSEPVRRAAMERARDQNEAALSGKVFLVQETETDIQAGTLMYVPVYRTGMPTGTVEQRSEALFGWVYSPYRMTDLMRGTLGAWDTQEGLRIRLQVYDGTLLSPETILYDSQAAKDMGPSQFTEELQVIFNGSPWTLRFTQAGGQVSLAKVWGPFASGMIISFLLFGLALSLLNSRSNALQMAKRLTTELRESEGFLSQSEKISGIGGWKANPFTNTLRWTQGVYDILDAPKDYNPGLDAGLEFYTPAYRPIIKEAIAKTLETGEPFKVEAEVTTTGGKHLWTEVRGLKRVPEGDEPQIIGSFQDITERKWIEEVLRESEGRFRGMFESHSAAMLLIEPETGRIVDANIAAERFYGYTTSQLRSMSIQEINILPPDEVEMERFLALQECRNFFVFPHRLASGEVRTVEVHSSPIQHNGKVMLFSIIHDISERKRLEGEVKQAAEKFRTVADFTYDWEYWIDHDGCIIYMSPACERITGYAADEFMNNSGLIQEIIHPEDRAFVADHVASIDSGPPHQSEFRIVTRSGATHWIGHVCQAVYGADGTWLGRRVSNRDITNLKKAERNLQELNENLEERVIERSEELTAANRQLLSEIQEHADTACCLRDSEKSVKMIIESSPIGIFVIQDEKYSFVNQAFIKIFGLTDSSDVIGKPPETPYSNDSGGSFNEIVRQCVNRSEMINVTDLKALTQDQRERRLNLWLQPTEFWGSSAVMGFIIDVSEELELRTHLNQAQKMEALGSLAGGIAHDFNNVLFAITGYTELALSSAPAGSKLNGQLQQVLGAAGRAAELVKHILTFSREREQEKKPLIIGPIVKESLNFLRASITQNTEIRGNIRADLHTVNGDPTQIHQIIMNLVTNAYHAMKNTGGTLGVSLDEVDLTPDFVKTRPGMLPGTYQRLMVSDTGHGMSPETLERIFEPYFTTKEVGEGTGLGLSVVHGIVREHGGAITVQSVPDAGTTFEVYFPIIVDKKISSEETEKAAPRGSGRILFVDDETMVTDSTKSNLENLGYKVHTENDPVRALAKFEAQPYSFDLVITDMSMPKMTGLQLSRQISQIREDLPIILITGFSDLLDDHSLLEYGIRELIHKPIRKVILAEAISNILTKQDN